MSGGTLEAPGVPGWAVLVCAGLLGLLIGSFLNVVIWRVPRGESVRRPPSACPSCGHPVRPRDNVPVISWLLLKGRCRDCAAPISARYPAIEAGTGIAFVLVAWRFGITWEGAAFAYLAALCIALTLIDLAVHRLPDVLVLPAYPVLLVLLAASSTQADDWWPLLRAAIGGAALFAFYFITAVVYPGGMGFGDVKLAGVLGMALAWIGWGALVVGAFAAFLLGGLAGIVLLAARRAGRRSAIPFGPWMVGGAALGAAFGEQVWTMYSGLWS